MPVEPDGKVNCPKKALGRPLCGTLEPVVEHGRIVRYECTGCRERWTVENVRALELARAHPRPRRRVNPKRMPIPASQMNLFEVEAESQRR